MIQATVDALGDAAAAAVTFLVMVQGRLAYLDGQVAAARWPGRPSWPVWPPILLVASTC